MDSLKKTSHSHRPVRVLPEDVARKIAAGEVIDRPYAVVRELLDNALDAGAKDITLTLHNGGIDLIRVSDDGVGMSLEDLEVCWLPHATSKIVRAEDLEEVSTLGFRGEALASLAACARLEVISAPAQGEAHRLRVDGGKVLDLAPHSGPPGTTVESRDLFFNIPARRRFLKNGRTEANLCRRIFLEKAAAHPEVGFRLFTDGVLKTYLPPGDRQKRVNDAWPRLAPPPSWTSCQTEGQGFSLEVVLARPESSRRDRQFIQIYANRRRIDEFSLVQGVTYAYDAWMPGGAFPMAFVFVEIDPALVDFNIHPAKKEARFRDLPAIRHRLVESIKDALSRWAYQERAAEAETAPQQKDLLVHEAPPTTGFDTTGFAWGRGSAPLMKPAAKTVENWGRDVGRLTKEHSLPRRAVPVPQAQGESLRYMGQIMGVFLLAERGDSLFVVDQHAAHERVLFDRLRDADPQADRLLIPRPLNLEREAETLLELRQDRLGALGIQVGQDDQGTWTLEALPRSAAGLEKEVAEFLESGAGDAEGLEKALWADLACKAAVKDGDALDAVTAEKLLEETFALPVPRCPHGRPLWFQVSREELFSLVGRVF